MIKKNLKLALCELAGVSEKEPASLIDMSKFEEVLDINIAVLSAATGNKFIRVPSPELKRRPLLYLYMVGEGKQTHFHSLINPKGFFGKEFCQKCFATLQKYNRSSL